MTDKPRLFYQLNDISYDPVAEDLVKQMAASGVLYHDLFDYSLPADPVAALERCGYVWVDGRWVRPSSGDTDD